MMGRHFIPYREDSKKNYGEYRDSADANLCNDQIKLGAVLRIADACEVMAKRHTELIAERDKFERWYKERNKEIDRLYRVIRSLRGVITRMKKL